MGNHAITDTSHVHVNRKEYWAIFGLLFVLTVIEVGYVYTGIGKTLMVGGLAVMALCKAALVGYFFMHLGHETRTLKATVAVPLAVPFVYALVLIAEAAWRMLG